MLRDLPFVVRLSLTKPLTRDLSSCCFCTFSDLAIFKLRRSANCHVWAQQSGWIHYCPHDLVHTRSGCLTFFCHFPTFRSRGTACVLEVNGMTGGFFPSLCQEFPCFMHTKTSEILVFKIVVNSWRCRSFSIIDL